MASFRDLNGNGRLDPYEDPARPVEERVEDLLSQMTLEEKAGLLFHPPILMNTDGSLIEDGDDFFRGGTTKLVSARHLNHFNIYYAPEPRLHAEWQNRLQRLAESTRLGIPVTVSSDPRHSLSENIAASWSAGGFSHWPEPIGFGALRDAEAMREFGDIARREYRAVGIHVALHPMADLATEPRWARIMHTFGEDVDLAARLVAAYVLGFQGEQLGSQSVACMTKHFPGGGPQKDGEDPHFSYGKDQVYPGGMFDYHLRVFEAAFAAGTAQIMPYYGRPIGTPLEEVGFGFNRDVVTGLLRERYGFDGVVCTDWGLVTDAPMPDGSVFAAKCWGVEGLSAEDRLVKIIEAGCDQLGGESLPELLVEVVRAGRVSESRIDESARRLLRDKFRLGLFDDPYVDPDEAERVCGCAEFQASGGRSQRRSAVLLTNDGTLPLAETRLYLDGVSADVAAAYGEIVERPEDADVAVVRRAAPFEPRSGTFIESVFHAGDLDFKEPELGQLLELARRVPTVLVLHLERPAVIPELVDACAAIVAVFGASDEAVLDVLHGRSAPEGRLPFELPSSMAAVRAQKPDVPADSEAPLFAFGHGLSYG
ncbi:MAG TPA: glycoside hydrolase family 3 N-terminal domain-containing protein [Gaiellaceae bacterium]|nr:glycoside hydrolase family 3 N-terminal domain-containing protein [Gaiellaceae bacterium]